MGSYFSTVGVFSVSLHHRISTGCYILYLYNALWSCFVTSQNTPYQLGYHRNKRFFSTVWSCQVHGMRLFDEPSSPGTHFPEMVYTPKRTASVWILVSECFNVLPLNKQAQLQLSSRNLQKVLMVWRLITQCLIHYVPHRQYLKHCEQLCYSGHTRSAGNLHNIGFQRVTLETDSTPDSIATNETMKTSENWSGLESCHRNGTRKGRFSSWGIFPTLDFNVLPWKRIPVQIP